MTKTNSIKADFYGVTFHVLNEDIFSFWYEDNGTLMHIVYPSCAVCDVNYSLEEGNHLSISVLEDCECIVTDCNDNDVVDSEPTRGSYFVMKPFNQSNVTYYGILGDDYDGMSDVVENNLIIIKVENDEIVEIVFDDDLLLEEEDMFRAPTNNEQEFIANALKDNGYFFNEKMCKIEKLN